MCSTRTQEDAYGREVHGIVTPQSHASLLIPQAFYPGVLSEARAVCRRALDKMREGEDDHQVR